MIATLTTLTADQHHLAGGKATNLAYLAQHNYPVPPALILLTTAFDATGLTATTTALEQQQTAVPAPYAVRSSALSEDGHRASFAGGFDTVLNVAPADLLAAIQTVFASRHNQRVQSYSQQQGLTTEHPMAVIIQQQLQPTFSGVLFTLDPVTADPSRMVGNFVAGLGEQLVSGEANPLAFHITLPEGTYHGPDELAPYTPQLLAYAQRLVQEHKTDQDIEWAIADDHLYLLQTRPVTIRHGHNPLIGAYNDSLARSCLWSNTNVGEAFPEVVTPHTWSYLEQFFLPPQLADVGHLYQMAGIIGGRVYMNISGLFSIAAAVGMPKKILKRRLTELFGQLPPDIDLPLLPVSGWALLTELVPAGWRRSRHIKKIKQQLPTLIDQVPQQYTQAQAAINATTTPAQLSQLWHDQLADLFTLACDLLAGGISDLKGAVPKLREQLLPLVGEADTEALLSSQQTDDLASLGPLQALTEVKNGRLTRDDYLTRYGHRAPNELELAAPRPHEDPTWLNQQLATLADIDVNAMLARQRQHHEAAWQRLQTHHPWRARRIHKKLQHIAFAYHQREASRSAATLLWGLLRQFALKAGHLTGLNEDIFWLTQAETLALLTGDQSPLPHIPLRREIHEAYCALPPYPGIINGRFNPFTWAANPQRRADIFDATRQTPLPTTNIIKGFPGSAGITEGYVRILTSPAQGHELRPGEILVATTTNIGWTSIFPRAAAIVTDVGAPLSHAAIVARELGITAVVGCGNATSYLQTGDYVRVNGQTGIVEKISPPPAPDSSESSPVVSH